MSIDIESESVFPLTRVPDSCPFLRHVSYKTIFGWTRTGARGVLLESFLLGGCRYTSIEAVERFIAASNPGPDGKSFTPTRRRREKERAARDARRRVGS